jgi:PAS domain S-box-containing protein
MKSSKRSHAGPAPTTGGKRPATGSNFLTKSLQLAAPSPHEPDLTSKLQEVVDAAIDISGSHFGTIQLLDQESGILKIAAHRGFPQWWINFWNDVPVGNSSCGLSLERRRRVIVEDLKKNQVFTGQALEMHLRVGVRAIQSTPIVSRSGTPLGVFSTHYKRRYRPDQRTIRLLDLLAGQAADVIGEAQYRAALHQSEELFRALVTASSYVVYRMSPDWTEMRELDGKGFLSDTKAPSGRWLQKYIHPEDQPYVIEAIRKAIRTKRPFTHEHRVRRADGTLGWTLSWAVPLLGANGEITEWFGSASDVTPWKQSEAEAQAVMDVAPVAIFIARDPQCMEITGNRMAYEMLGLPVGSNLSMSAPSGERPEGIRILKNGLEVLACELPMQKAAATGQTIRNSEFDVVYPDGRRRSWLGNAVPLLGANNRPRGAVGTFLDATTLKDTEERFRAFVENAPVAVIIHEPGGKMMVVNSEALRMFGYSREDMIGQGVEMLLPSRLRHKHFEERALYVRKPTNRPMGIGLELRGQRKDGSEFPIEVSLSPVETSSGTFVSATIFDLTDRKRLEEQTRLATVLQERARVARNLHDTLAQGFTGIIMNLEVAKDVSANLPEEARVRLKKAEEVARENLEQVRHSLMELSAPTTRGVEDLSGSLRELARGAHSNGKTKVKFSLRGIPRPLNRIAAENLLFIAQQATDNAVRHANANLIHIKLSFSEREIRLQIEDNGGGFDVRKVSQGIGLTGMGDRAEYIGGRFALKSQPGKGTEVEVRILLSQKQSREAKW